MAGISSTPRDGGRGKEWRRGSFVVRWFNKNHGYLGFRRGERWYCLRWLIGLGHHNSGNVLGVYTARNEDGGIDVMAGMWFANWFLEVSG